MDTYIEAGSINEINVPDSQRKLIFERRGQAQPDIFLDVQKYVTHMLIRNVDSTWKYKKSFSTQNIER